MIYKFIWSNGGCRVARSTLYLPKGRGGLGVPHSLRYYRAAQLVQLYQIFATTYQPDWVRVEAQASPTLPLDLLMLLPSRERRAILSPSLSHSVRLWDVACKLHPLKSHHSPMAPLFNNTHFPPGQQIQKFTSWTDNGLSRIVHFIDHKVLILGKH